MFLKLFSSLIIDGERNGVDQIYYFLQEHYEWYRYDKALWLDHTKKLLLKEQLLLRGTKAEVDVKYALKWIEQKYELEIDDIAIKDTDRLEWLGSPSLLGYVISEFVEKGYLVMPKTNGKPSYAKFTKLLMQVFDTGSTFDAINKEINPKKILLLTRNDAKSPSLSYVT